jgi:16S rRNA (cytosine967-C5)-methyltransferase
VQASKAVGLFRASGLVNAVLRAWLRLLEDNPDLEPSPLHPPDSAEFLSIKYSHPLWLVEQWLTQFGPQPAADWLSACQREPRASIRVNRLKISAPELQRHLSAAAEISCHELEPDCLLSSSGQNSLPGFAQGWWQGQDPGASAISPLLNPIPGSRVLDMCAGIGGKTSHLAGLMQNQGELVAVEVARGRAQALEVNLRRLGVGNARILLMDACQLPYRAYFDYILLDAPCSGLGTTRRRPDLRWRRTPQDLPPLVGLQRQLLARAVEALKPGGYLLYATCTTAEAENSGNINWLLQTCSSMGISWQEDNSLIGRDNFWKTYPRFREADGFFAVRMQKGTGKCCK